MRLGVDGSCWANRRGYGRYARELVQAMASQAPEVEFICFVDSEAARVGGVGGPNVRIVEVSQSAPPTQAASSRGSRSPLDMLRFSHAVWREELDAFFSPSVYTYFPLPPRLPAVVAIHDAIAERFPELTLPTWKARLFWRMKVGLALRQAGLVLTVSDFAAREISEIHGLSPERIRVAVEAPAAIYRPELDQGTIQCVTRQMGLPSGARWFTYVGGFNPHKNVDLLVRAHAEILRTTSTDVRPYLLLVGATEGDVFHGSLTEIRRAIREEGTADRVIWAGYVPDRELRSIHTGALALALPSECEGFGLPAVEAAACRCPVIATTASPLPDLLEGGGIFVSPGDLNGLIEALREMLEDDVKREAMAIRAYQRASRLNWSASAASALDAIREAAA